VNIVNYERALLFTTETLKRHVDAITHVYFCVEYSVITMQLPQHSTYKMKHCFPYTIVYERKQLTLIDENSSTKEKFT